MPTDPVPAWSFAHGEAFKVGLHPRSSPAERNGRQRRVTVTSPDLASAGSRSLVGELADPAPD
ncbi:MAG: hypothetical protein NVS3B21_32650 [Acidimicrobiales bacterium]